MFAFFRTNIPAAIFGGLAAIFAIIAVVQTVRLDGFLWFPGLKDKYETAINKLVEARRELEAISSKKNEQRTITVERIKEVDRAERKAAPIVKIIREAPIPPNCATPGLEILRNEI